MSVFYFHYENYRLMLERVVDVDFSDVYCKPVESTCGISLDKIESENYL